MASTIEAMPAQVMTTLTTAVAKAAGAGAGAVKLSKLEKPKKELLAPLIVRTEAHALRTTPEFRSDVDRTLQAYRQSVRALSTILMTHWPELGSLPAKGKCQAIEALFHPTAKRPVVRYEAMGRIFGKMPSYLRRAAIEAAYGAVRAFLSNYDHWLDGQIGGKAREAGSRAPRMGRSEAFPPLYGGNMLLVGTRELPAKKLRAIDKDDFVGPRKPIKILSAKQLAAHAGKTITTPHGSVRIKLLGSNGQWAFSAPVAMRGKPKRMGDLGGMALSPTLMQRGTKTWLSCPVELRPPKYSTNDALVRSATPFRVCAVDVGINTAATLAIVDSTGTVIARKFLTCGRHNDQRDNLGVAIGRRQKLSGGTRRGEAFCADLHRRIAGLSKDAARGLASSIAAFAHAHGAQLLVIEDLKGWKPKGPCRAQRKRFHRFQHRMLVQCLALKAQEFGMRMLSVYARGTSSFAYDGSGLVKRSTKNAQLATFASGKQFNADLNGALNIAARGLASVLGLTTGRVVKVPEKDETIAEAVPATALPAEKKPEAVTGKRSGAAVRMPLVLADIWTWSQIASGSLVTQRMPHGHSNRPSKAAGVCS